MFLKIEIFELYLLHFNLGQLILGSDFEVMFLPGTVLCVLSIEYNPDSKLERQSNYVLELIVS